MAQIPQTYSGYLRGKFLITFVIHFALLVAIAPEVRADADTSNGPPLILVGGATGKQGGAVVDELLLRGYAVRGMTRKPESRKAQRAAAKGIELVYGDYGNEKSLRDAMRGVDGVFFYTAFSPDELRQGVNVIEAAQAEGVEHLIYSLGAAADPVDGMPGSLAGQVEMAIRESGVPYTILRPVAFMENYRGQQKRIAKTGIVDSRAPDRIATMISVRDIGFFVAEAFEQPDEWLGVAVNISSDEMTMAELAATFSRVMGRDIPYNRTPLEEYLAMLPKPLRPLFRWYEEVGYQADTAAWRARYPELTTLEAYLVETGWQDWQPAQ